MGKHKQSNRQAKNVFKVAGARSLKLKNKAKAVSTQLKKLNEITRKKTAEVDGQLTTELQAKLLQKQEAQKTVVEKVTVNKTEKQFQDCEKDSSEALSKLCEMQVN